jgi:Sigma-70 region 2
MSCNHEINPESLPDPRPAVAVFISGRRKFLDFLRARVSDPTDAEEILQRASVKILERGADLRESTSAEAWIYRLLRNELVNHYRRTALHSKKTVEMPPDFDRPAPMPVLEHALVHARPPRCRHSYQTTQTPCVPWRCRTKQCQATPHARGFRSTTPECVCIAPEGRCAPVSRRNAASAQEQVVFPAVARHKCEKRRRHC